MRIEQLVDSEIKSKLGFKNDSKVKHPLSKKKRNKRHSENLTRRDIEELMGTNRQTYKRVNGKIKRK